MARAEVNSPFTNNIKLFIWKRGKLLPCLFNIIVEEVASNGVERKTCWTFKHKL